MPQRQNERPQKGKPEKYQRKCKTEKLPVTFKVNPKRKKTNCVTYQMKGKKRKGLLLTRINVFNSVDFDGKIFITRVHNSRLSLSA